MTDTELWDEAVEEAHYRTFTDRLGPFMSGVSMLRNVDQYPVGGLVGRVVVPFLRTPANLVAYGLERSPLAPFVPQARANLRAGGIRRAEAEGAHPCRLHVDAAGGRSRVARTGHRGRYAE